MISVAYNYYSYMCDVGILIAYIRVMKRQRYYTVCICCMCGGVYGLKWHDTESQHLASSHGYCSNCLIQLYKEQF